MLTRTAFGLAIVLASVSGSLAFETHTVYNPFGARIAAPRPQSDCTIYGFPCKEVWPYKRQ